MGALYSVLGVVGRARVFSFAHGSRPTARGFLPPGSLKNFIPADVIHAGVEIPSFRLLLSSQYPVLGSLLSFTTINHRLDIVTSVNSMTYNSRNASIGEISRTIQRPFETIRAQFGTIGDNWR
jgi:hypothetical protein